MRKKIFILASYLLCIFLLPTIGSAADWTNSPEDTMPSWVTAAPYQRDIYWDFTSDPEGSGYPLLGAEYSGTHDSSLGVADSVNLLGDLVYDPDNNRVSMFGSNPMGPTEGGVTIKLGNLVNSNPIKNFYLEGIFYYSGDPNNLPPSLWDIAELTASDGASMTEGSEVCVLENIGAGTYLFNMWAEITPNPGWEQIEFDFFIGPGETYWIDDVHIATECVPIPSAVWLLGSAFIGLVGFRQKYRKR